LHSFPARRSSDLLRGLHRDHAPADRAGGRRRPPVRRGRPDRPREVPRRQGPGRRQRGRLLRQVAAPAGRRTGTAPRRVRRLQARHRPVTAPALRRAHLPQAGPLHLLRHVPLAGEDGDQAGLPRPDRRHRRRTVRHERRLRPRRTAARPGRARPRGVPARGRLLPPVPHPGRRTLRPPVDQPRRPRPQGRQGRPVRHLHLAGAGRRRPLRRRPLDRGRGPRPEHEGERAPADPLTNPPVRAAAGRRRTRTTGCRGGARQPPRPDTIEPMTDAPAPLADPHLVYDPVTGDGPKDVAILGSTGSIGTQAIDLVLRNPDRFRVTGLSAHGSRTALLAEQAHRLRARPVAVARPAAAPALREALSARDGAGEPLPEILAGPDAATEVAASDCHTVLNGITGSIGLAPTLAALEAGRTLALANKESLIVGGPLVKALAEPGQIIPVDSEHAALFQALAAGTRADVRKLVVTASGGPFRGRTRAELADVTVDDALAHPTWAMGPVITINSATLVNKGLE